MYSNISATQPAMEISWFSQDDGRLETYVAGCRLSITPRVTSTQEYLVEVHWPAGWPAVAVFRLLDDAQYWAVSVAHSFNP